MPSATGITPMRSDHATCSPRDPPEHHPERRHQEVIGARCRCPTDRQKVEPEQVTAHRNEKHRVGERAEQRANSARSLPPPRIRRRTGAIASPPARFCTPLPTHNPPFGSQALEQNGPADQRHQRRDREGDADGIINSAADPALDDEGNTTDPSSSPAVFRPGHPLVQEYRSEHDREYRVGADDQGGKAGRYASHADVIEPEVERVIGDAKDAKHQDVATEDATVRRPRPRP